LQWQATTRTGSPLTRYRVDPQAQPPDCSMISSLSRL
jgi:hypothetical protein